MNTVELIQYALGNTFGILDQVTSDLTQEMADMPAPGIANPIGATYWHAVSGVDEVVHRWIGGQEPLYECQGWQDKVLTVSAPEPRVGGGDYLTYMRTIRIDLPTMHTYSEAVANALQCFLGELTAEDLDRTIDTPIGQYNLAQVLEVFALWHISAHCGEIAALKGAQGVKGYPF